MTAGEISLATAIALSADRQQCSSMSGSDSSIWPTTEPMNAWSSTSRTTIGRRPRGGREPVSVVGSIMRHFDRRVVCVDGLYQRAQVSGGRSASGSGVDAYVTLAG